jgi:hypothetical protein
VACDIMSNITEVKLSKLTLSEIVTVVK